MKLQPKYKMRAFLKCLRLSSLILVVSTLLVSNVWAVPLSYEVTRSTGISYNSIALSGITIPSGSWRNGTNSDDNLSNSIPIGFNFSYQGITYANILVSTNGFITFNTGTVATGTGSGAYGAANGNFSSTSVSSVAPLYDDLTSQGLSTSFKYLTTGAAGSRVLTVEWIGMDYQSTGASLNFQVKLYETSNNIEFVYGSMSAFDGSHNQTYSYSAGLNASSITAPPLLGELFTQQIANTRSFGFTATNSLTIVPQCFSSILFTPGVYTPYVPGSSTVVNDNSSGALPLGVNSSPCTNFCGTYYSSAGATSSGVATCAGTADDDVWFTFTATGPSISIKVRGAGGYDAVVELLDNSLNSITCQNLATSGLTETINATGLTNGNTYYVRVYHFGSMSGTNGVFSICVYLTPTPPVNDDCAGAITLPVTASQTLTAGTNTSTAQASAGIPSPCIGTTVPDDDVWYKFIAPTSSATILVQSAAGFDAVIQAFSGACGSLVSLQCVNANVGGNEMINLSNLTINATYFFRVYHASIGSGTGSYSLVVYSNPPACPASNVFSPSSTNYVNASGVFLRWAKSLNASSYDVYLDTLATPVHLLAANVTDTNLFSGVLQQGRTYYWQVIAKNAVGNSSGCTIHVFATTPPDQVLVLKAFLQGLYTGNRTMRASIDPVLYPTVADTIRVSLARSVPPYDVLYTTKALLSTSGVARCSFPNSSGFGNYYVIVNHRNSVETWSYIQFGFLIDYGDTIFDFTTSQAAGNHRAANPIGSHPASLENQNTFNRTDFDVIDRNIQTDILREEE